MKKVLIILGILALTACAVPPGAEQPSEEKKVKETPVTPPDLPDLGPAPEFVNDVWLNTDEPLRLATNLKGKVVLVEMWTFG